MKEFNTTKTIRWNKKEFQRLKKVAPKGKISDFIRKITMKEVERIEKKKAFYRRRQRKQN